MSSLRVTPPSLSFPVGSDLLVNSVEIENLTEQYVTYKIRTNKPESYLVRPNCGILMPKNSCEIQMLLKGNDPTVKPSNKDRFMVLVQKIDNADAVKPLEKLWENPPDDKIEKLIIKCNVSGNMEESQEASQLMRSFHSVVHSDIADNLKKQNQEFCAKAQLLSQENKHLKEEKQKLQAQQISTKQEMINLQEQLDQYKTGSMSNTGAPLLSATGQGMLALVAFLLGYLLAYFF